MKFNLSPAWALVPALVLIPTGAALLARELATTYEIKTARSRLEERKSAASALQAESWATPTHAYVERGKDMPLPAAIEKVMPSVVAVESHYAPTASAALYFFPGERKDVFRGVLEPQRPDDKPRRAGTGFAVAPSVIMTASHVVGPDPRQRYSVKIGGKSYPVLRIRYSRRFDAALLYVAPEAPPVQPVVLAQHLPRTGESLAAIGMPTTGRKTIQTGIMSAMRATNAYAQGGEAPLIEAAIQTYPGFSGGPLLNLKGEVVGIISTGYELRSLSYAPPAGVAFADALRG